MKIESFFREEHAFNGSFSIWIEVGKNSTIFSQDGINPTDNHVCIFIDSVVKRVSAVIRTKFLVSSSNKFNGTF
jgi:hypothetical protein